MLSLGVSVTIGLAVFFSYKDSQRAAAWMAYQQLPGDENGDGSSGLPQVSMDRRERRAKKVEILARTNPNALSFVALNCRAAAEQQQATGWEGVEGAAVMWCCPSLTHGCLRACSATTRSVMHAHMPTPMQKHKQKSPNPLTQQ